MTSFKFHSSSVCRAGIQITLLSVVILLCIICFPAIAAKELIFDPLTWFIDVIGDRMEQIHEDQKQARRDYEKTL